MIEYGNLQTQVEYANLRMQADRDAALLFDLRLVLGVLRNEELLAAAKELTTEPSHALVEPSGRLAILLYGPDMTDLRLLPSDVDEIDAQKLCFDEVHESHVNLAYVIRVLFRSRRGVISDRVRHGEAGGYSL